MAKYGDMLSLSQWEVALCVSLKKNNHLILPVCVIYLLRKISNQLKHLVARESSSSHPMFQLWCLAKIHEVTQGHTESEGLSYG